MYYLVSKITWIKGLPEYTHVKFLENKKDAIDFNNFHTKKAEVEYICYHPDEDKGDLTLVTDMTDPENKLLPGGA